MLIKENKRKKVFSKKKDIDAYRFDLEPEYLGFEEFVGAGGTTQESNQIVHKFNIKIPIDRLNAIKSDFSFIEAYLVQDMSTARSRKKMMSGFNKHKKSNLNFAIVNKEILARNEMKTKDMAALTYPLFNVGIVHNVLLGLTKEKIKNLPEEEIFGYEEVIEPHKQISESSANKNILNIEKTNFNENVKNNKTFKPKSYDVYRKNIEPVSKDSFKREYIKMRASGIDPATIINLGKYNSQSLVDAIKGTLPQNFNYKKQIQFLKNYNSLIELTITNNKKSVSIIKKKRSKRHQVFEKVIKITAENLAKFNNSLSIIVYAKTKDKRKIDSYFLNYSFSDLKSKYQLSKSLESYEDAGISSVRKNNKVTLNLSNKSKNKITFNIERALVKKHRGIQDIEFKSYATSTVPPNSKRRAILNKDICLKHQSLFYRTNFVINGLKIDNTVFMHNPPIVSSVDNTTPAVGITAKNNFDNLELLATNIPPTSLGINVVKRNISKKEKDFSTIKTFSNLTEKGLVSLSDHRPKFFKKYKNRNAEFKFVDSDVEESSVYEYKLVSYMDNGEILKSCNSLIHKFEKKRSLIKIDLLDIASENIKNQIRNNQNASLAYRFKLSVKKNAIAELFDSLDRNTYELLATELEDIKNSLTQNLSCIFYLENISNTTFKEIQRLSPDKEGIVDIFFNLDNLFDKQNLVIEPRMKTSVDLIDNILEKIDSLPVLERKNLNTSFLKNLKSFKQKFKNADGKQYVSRIGEKYTSRSVRLLGTIVDPVTKFNKEGSDLYHDGRTGDIAKIRLPTENLESRIAIPKLINFLTSYDKSNNKVKMLINMNSKNSKFVDFYSIYTLSNGSLSFKGLMAASDKYSKNYSFYLDLKNETGLVELFVAGVTKNGTIIPPSQLAGFIIEKNNVRKV